MSFDWSEFLQVAEHLCDATVDAATPEALWRTAVGRSYYAAYHAAEVHYRNTRGCDPPRDGAARGRHMALMDALKSEGRLEECKIGATLEALYKARLDADYDSRSRLDLWKAEFAVNQAKQLVADIAGL